MPAIHLPFCLELLLWHQFLQCLENCHYVVYDLAPTMSACFQLSDAEQGVMPLNNHVFSDIQSEFH